MNDLLDVLKVTVLPEYRLALEFENGERRFFDMSTYMEKNPL